MLPSDVTGTLTLRAGELVFRPGPVFAGVVLADEINRTPPKTQAALLEAMQEGQVTVDGESHPLPDPFLVLATQNPVEYEGTYPLPEAQRDRFLVHVAIGYPDAGDERAMLRLARRGLAPTALEDVRPVASAERPARGAGAGGRDRASPTRSSATWSRSCAARASSRASRSAPARAPPSICSAPRRRRPASAAAAT